MSSEFYQQPHIFLVFKAGSAGNLISSMLDYLNNASIKEITISITGNAHNNEIVKRKRSGTDYISLGSGISDTEIKFFTAEEKLAYYKEKIDNFPYENRRYVTWTHDFNNVDLYKILFPNSKTVEITTDSIHEKIIGIIFHVNKNIFDPWGNSPLKEPDQILTEIIKKKIIQKSFRLLYKDKKYQEGWPDLDLHLVYSYYQKILGINETVMSQNLTLLEEKIIDSFGKPASSTADYKIKLIDILKGEGKNISNIVNVFSNVLNRTLDDLEIGYVNTTVQNYISSQNFDIINDPFSYLNEVRKKADNIVSAFKALA